MPTRHLIIKGKVQGVFYRATAKEVADKLAIKGWIKNTDDDDVEATVTGTNEHLKEFVEWCWQGPAKADVKDVIVSEVVDEDFREFKIIRRY
jgi:acylphosphatase